VRRRFPRRRRRHGAGAALQARAGVLRRSAQSQDLKVMRSLGLGLDEKAIEAVEKWKFRPGYKDGKPVTVAATVEVNFRLL